MAYTDGPLGLMETRSRAIWLTCVITPFFTGIFLFLRMYSRTFITKKIYSSDWVALATMPFIIAYSILISFAADNGMGRHVNDFTPDLEARMYFWIMVGSLFYVLSLFGYKIAILLLYLNIFGIHKRFRWLCYGVGFFCFAYLTCNFVTELAGCRPIQAFYDKRVKGDCIKVTNVNIFYGACSMFSDLVIVIMPIPLIMKLQFKTKREKIGLWLVLAGGAVAFVVATVRWIYATVDLTSQDRTWIAGMTFLWSILEVNTGLICSCTPAMKPLLTCVKERKANWSERRASRKDSVATGTRKGSIEEAIFAGDQKLSPAPLVHQASGTSNSSSDQSARSNEKSEVVDEDDDLAFEQMIRRA